MEVYVDDMLVKSEQSSDHTKDLAEMFGILRRYWMKLNPLKCSFGVASGKFLGSIVSSRGIKINPDQIAAIRNIKEPRKIRDVQSLAGKVAAVGRFISKAIDKCVPFFDLIKRGKGNFEWTPDCMEAFQNLLDFLEKPPILSKPMQHEDLFVYLAVSSHAVSAALVRE